MKKRILSLLMALALCLSLLPVTALAGAAATKFYAKDDGGTVYLYATTADGRTECTFGQDDLRDNFPNATKVVIAEPLVPSTTAYLFSYLEKLETIEGLDKLGTAKVTDMSYMFNHCLALTSLDLSGLNTDKVTNMHGMFRGCEALTSLDLSSFNTANVTDMGEIFYYCKALTSLDLSGFNTANVTNMSSMFQDCNKLVSLTFGDNFKTGNVTDMSFMFYDCYVLKSLDVSKFDTSNVTNMGYMFAWCEAVTSLDVSKFNTAKVTNMTYMFAYCELPTSLDVSEFDTGNVTNMNGMFFACQHLKSLDVSNFDTSKVTNMSYMFYDCEALTKLDLSEFNTANVTTMEEMFGNCWELTDLDLRNFNTAKVTSMSYMFCGCHKLKSLDVSSFNTSKVKNMNAMFSTCNVLPSLDLSSFDMSLVTNSNNMFSVCPVLTYLKTPKNCGVSTNLTTDNYYSATVINTFYNQADPDKTYTTVPNTDASLTLIKKDCYAIEVAPAVNGTVIPTAAKAGSKVTLTVMPDEGYVVDTLTVKTAGGENVPVTAYQFFTMPSEAVTVTAAFKLGSPLAAPVESDFTMKQETVKNRGDAYLEGVTDEYEFRIQPGVEWVSGDGRSIGVPADAKVEIRRKASLAGLASASLTLEFTPSEQLITVKMGDETVQLAAGEKITEKTPVKTGYAFGGWYIDEELKDRWNFSDKLNDATLNMLRDQFGNLSDDFVVTFYPKWIAESIPSSVVGGEVTMGGVAVPGADVQLWRGSEKIQTVTDSNGNYGFGRVENGMYNIVVTKDEKIRTTLVNVDSLTGTYDVPAIALSNVSSMVSRDEYRDKNTAMVDIDGALVGGLDTYADAHGNNGDMMALYIERQEENGLWEYDADAAAFKTKADSKATLEYFDLMMVKYDDDYDWWGIHDTGDNLITIVLPFNFKNVVSGSVKVIRQHQLNDPEAMTENPAANAEGFIADESAGTVTIKASKFSIYAIAFEVEDEDEDEDELSGKKANFFDVSRNAYYYNAVKWAVENGVTQGKTTTKFDPSGPVTRAQAVTFLWRAAGCPKVNYLMQFTDLKPGAYYTEAVRWAVAMGITNGTDAKHFSPDATCTRAQIVSFLYRYAKTNVRVTNNPFTDVKAGAYYYDAVLWANANGITGGKTATTFAPADTCNRAQVVTFLYRWMVK